MYCQACAPGEACRGKPAASAIRLVDGRVEIQTDKGPVHRVDQLLATLPTRLFTRLAVDLPPDFVERYPGPEHFGAHVLVLGL